MPNGINLKARGIALSILVVVVVTLTTYYPALGSGFFLLDDYTYLEWVARLPLSEYIAQSFDPRIPTMGFRPMLRVLFLLEYSVFRLEAVYYHLTQITLHLANALLLFAIIHTLSLRWRVALLAAILYVGFPLYSEAVFWISVHDPLATCFYLLAFWFWLSHLKTGNKSFYWLAIILFCCALLSKEIAVTLPVALFLTDRLIVKSDAGFRVLLRRYLPLFPITMLYLMLEYAVQVNGFWLTDGKYSIGEHAIFNFLECLRLLASPWGLDETLSSVWRVIPALYVVNLVWKKSAVLFLMGIMLLLSLAPTLPSPFGPDPRFLYFPAIIFAVFFAMLFESGFGSRQRSIVRILGAMIVSGLVIMGNGFGVAGASTFFSERVRIARIPFRDVMRQHPTFPQDTLLYFVEPPFSSVPHIGSLFFHRYGASVSVDGTDVDGRHWLGGRYRAKPVRLRDHKQAFVFFFDETRRPIEVQVDKDAVVQSSLDLPVDFQVPLRLEGYEVTNSHPRRGQPMVLFLYWRATGRIDKDYTVFVHLVDPNGQIVAGFDSKPRDGKEQTSSWKVDRFIVDGRVLLIPDDVPSGEGYRLEVGLYYLPTLERVGIVNGTDAVIADRIVIGPFVVQE